MSAVHEAHETATHEENVARSKYETKSVEAAYLVQGQLRRSDEIESDIAAYQSMKIRSFDSTSRVLLSAYIEVETGDKDIKKLFMGPSTGGLIIDDITVITPKSPMGKSLLGKYVGEAVELIIDGNKQSYKILSLG